MMGDVDVLGVVPLRNGGGVSRHWPLVRQGQTIELVAVGNVDF